MRWDPGDPHARDVDSFILSKGHAAPLLWAVLAAAGAVDEDLLTLRRIDSTLEGHPTPRNPWVRVATGSLGQGLAAANGSPRPTGSTASMRACSACSATANARKDRSGRPRSSPRSTTRQRRRHRRRERSRPERTGALRPPQQVFAERFRAFGWHAVEIDGHDLAEVTNALEQAGGDRPTAIDRADRERQGRLVPRGKDGWHGKALDEAEMRARFGRARRRAARRRA